MMVELDFFETVVRYDKFFTCEPQHIPDALVSNTVYDLIITHAIVNTQNSF